jgi:hypothetical protein
LIGDLEVESGSEGWLRGDDAREENGHKRPTFEQGRMFMAFRGVIYMDVGGYNGKVGKSDKRNGRAVRMEVFGGLGLEVGSGDELLNF